MNDSTALQLSGRDALALLHRISTNQLAELKPGAARATLFCDFRGRLLHRAAVGVAADGTVWLFRCDAPGAPLAAFLDRHIFRDDVRITDHSMEMVVARATGTSDLAPGTMAERDGTPVAVRVDDDAPLLIGGPAGSSTSEDARHERERVRAGRAAHGHEIAEAFTPFEVGLAHEVHLDKGCYTGQETLMRLVTYQSVRRRLARISGTGAVPVPPLELQADSQNAGVLTSAVADADGWIGLAVVRNEIAEHPRALEIAGGGTTHAPEPFPARRALGRP